MKLLKITNVIAGITFALTATLSLADNTILSGTTPSPRTIEYPWMSVDTWKKMHTDDIAVAKKGNVDLLFVGDSITAGWNNKGLNNTLWQKYFAKYKPANFGIGGDHTGNILWRLQHGDKGNLKPKVIVLLIGVNNFGHLHETPFQVFDGIKLVISQLRNNYPHAKILVNSIFPFEESATSPKRALVKEANALIVTLDDQKYIFVKDYGNLFLQPDSTISKDIMADFLHPTEKGYEIWANAMLPDIQNLMN